MLELGKTLVVDDSRVYRDVMGTVLGSYCEAVLQAASVAAAVSTIDSDRDLDLVLCDVNLPDGPGFEVVEHIAGLAEPRPRVVMVTASPASGLVEEALRLGALGCLPKPTTVRQIQRALEFQGELPSKRRKPRWRCHSTAVLVERDLTEPAQIAWDVYNLSLDGAFLETKGPLPVGTEVDILLHLTTGKARVRGRVARIQDPSWIDVGGVGIEFIEFFEDAQEVIRRFVAGVGLTPDD